MASLVSSPGGFSGPSRGTIVYSIPLAPPDALPFDISLGMQVEMALGKPPQEISGVEFFTLMNHFHAFTNLSLAQANEKFHAVRKLVLQSIETIALEDPKLAECLVVLYNNRRLCIAAGAITSIDAEFHGDPDAGFGTGAINIYQIPCPQPGTNVIHLWEPDGFRLLNSLAHEGLHAIQTRYNGPRPTTPQLEAQQSLTNQCLEIEAAEAEIRRMTNLLAALDGIINHGQIPSGVQGIGARIAALLLNSGLTTGQIQARAERLRSQLLGDLLLDARATLQCRKVYKQALQYFLAGQLVPANGYNGTVKATTWFKHTEIKDQPEFRLISYLAGGGQLNSPATGLELEKKLRQIVIDADHTMTETSFDVPGLRSISGVMLKPPWIYFGGDALNNTTDGVVVGLQDTNGDGLFESNTSREILRSGFWRGGFEFTPRNFNGTAQTWVFTRNGNRAYELTGADAQGHPTGFAARGTVSTRQDLVNFLFSIDGRNVFGRSDAGIPYYPQQNWAWARINTITGNAEPRGNFDPYSEHQLAPALNETPWPGSRTLHISGTTSADVYAYQIAKSSMTMLGQAKTDPNGNALIHLTTPLMARQQIQFGYPGQSSSPIYTVPPDYPPQVDLLPYLERVNIRYAGEFGGFHVSGLGPPSASTEVQFTSNFDTWDNGGTVTASRFGQSFFPFETRQEIVSRIYRTYLGPPPLKGRNDFFTVAPGLKCQFHVAANDLFPPGATFQLTGPPPAVHPDLFNWSGNGSFNLTMLPLDQPFIDLLYTIVQGGKTSAPVAVTIVAEFSMLVNVGVTYNPQNGQHMAQVPCLLYGGRHYPLYQFHVGIGPECDPGRPLHHWHAFGPVFSLELPTVPVPDPGGCGFGKLQNVPVEIFSWPLDAYESFRQLHPPPI